METVSAIVINSWWESGSPARVLSHCHLSRSYLLVYLILVGFGVALGPPASLWSSIVPTHFGHENTNTNQTSVPVRNETNGVT